MSTPAAARTSALLVVVASGADPTHTADLAGALAHRLEQVHLLVPADEHAGAEPYRLALEIADAVEATWGKRPVAAEVGPDLGRDLAQRLTGLPAHRIVALGPDLGRRATRAVRRAAARAGAHVAVLRGPQVAT
ncbi:MAG: hypothetical protein ACLGIC_11075 [Acidimicrobiia bacterium]